MKKQFVNEVIEKLGDRFTEEQKSTVSQVITICLGKYEISEAVTDLVPVNEGKREKFYKMFLVTKKIEGCTQNTLRYYGSEIRKFAYKVNKQWEDVTTDDIRIYIAEMAIERKCSKATQDNTLRILRSFFGWLASEEHIAKDPTKKIKKIKQEKRIKKPFTEVECEQLRNGARNQRERAIIELLLSTGMRVSELCGLDISDIQGDQAVVYGKGEKERYVYLNAKSQVALELYLKQRSDDNPALMVSEQEPHKRLQISAVESTLRDLGRELGIKDVHPHRFRRTAATLALNRGMPIDQVQQMLGHEQIATTLIYAQAAQETVKASHKKFLS